MCCFSRPVRLVSSTSIFARMASPGRQLLAYSMTLEASEDLAMILPLPVPPETPERGVRFLDLSGYAGFFLDLAAAFPQEYDFPRSGGLFAPQSLARQAPLPVQDVGDFEASFVPSMADFSRLDPRFRLDGAVWRQLPRYADHGFAVFQLKGFGGGLLSRWFRRARERKIHPMAFEFPTREPRRLFYPTVHIHDGAVHEEADFDHALYAQTSAAPDGVAVGPGEAPAPAPWQRGEDAARHLRLAATGGLVSPDIPLFRLTLRGHLPNADRWVDLGA